MPTIGQCGRGCCCRCCGLSIEYSRPDTAEVIVVAVVAFLHCWLQSIQQLATVKQIRKWRNGADWNQSAADE